MPDDLENDDDTPDESKVIKDLRKRAAEAEQLHEEMQKANAEIAEFKRNDAFRGVGLDPSVRLHAQLIKAYDGELESAAVKQYVDELGITTASPQPAPQVPAQEMQAWQQAAHTPTGGETPPPQPALEDRYREVFNSLPELGRVEAFGEWLETQGQEVSHDGVIPGSGMRWPGMNADWNSDRGQVPRPNPVPPP